MVEIDKIIKEAKEKIEFEKKLPIIDRLKYCSSASWNILLSNLVKELDNYTLVPNEEYEELLKLLESAYSFIPDGVESPYFDLGQKIGEVLLNKLGPSE
jgi:hypothetical protein